MANACLLQAGGSLNIHNYCAVSSKKEIIMTCKWKPNWLETREHFINWWNREGLVMTVGGAPPPSEPHEAAEDPGELGSKEKERTSPAWRAERNHYNLAYSTFPVDTLPIAETLIGPGSLALLIGCEPGFSPETVWFKPAIKDEKNPESLPPLRFDPKNKWWRIHEGILKECASRAAGKYLVGCPDLVENIDILAALRSPQNLLFDMIERPEWVEEKVWEINEVFFEAYNRIFEIIKQPDGSSAFGVFELWGPGKTVKVQCDASAMFSPEMFERFVVPALSQQCRWLDNSLYHLDGTQCIPHLDLLFGIDELDAIQWTPQAGIEGCGHPRWFDMYRRILEAGKSVQAIGVRPEQVEPLLKAIGGKGVYIKVKLDGAGKEQLDELLNLADKYRPSN